VAELPVQHAGASPIAQFDLVGRVGHPVDRGRHVLRRHRRAVVELHALADLERPLRRVGVRRPRLGEPRRQLLVLADAQELAGQCEHRETAGVAVLDRVDLGRRCRDAEPDRAALPSGRRRCCQAARCRPPRRCLFVSFAPPQAAIRNEIIGSESRPRSPPDELAAVEATRHVLIDDVVLDVVPAAAEHPARR
jgi:hypothetical protein